MAVVFIFARLLIIDKRLKDGVQLDLSVDPEPDMCG
jgi:hypothetical protein